MIENLPYKSLEYRNLTIEGYSRGAVQSYWRIPELKIGFDLGGSPWNFMSLPTVMISHAHLDHLAALPVFVARRRMMKMDPPTIYLPAEITENTQKMLHAWQRLDRGRMVCNLIGVEPGQEFELTRQHVVTVFKTQHTVPSVGYVVWDRRRKLKSEYQSLGNDAIRDLRLSGTEVTHEVRVPLFCYAGDTAPKSLDDYPPAYEAEILMTEMTFFRPEHRKDKIHKFGHTHLDDIIERAERFQNKLIIFTHFSSRYFERQIERSVRRKLPETLRDRVHLWL